MKEIELVVDKKYELLKDDYIKVGERTVYRIRALKDFGNVKKGDLGGYIAKEENLSHDRNAWVFDNAVVVGEEAAVYDDAEIHDNVRVYDRAKVYHDARVYGNTVIRWEARVSGDAQVFDNVEISGKAKVYGDCHIAAGTTATGDNTLTSYRDFVNFKNPYSYNEYTWVKNSNKIYRNDPGLFLFGASNPNETIEQFREAEKARSFNPDIAEKAIKALDAFLEMTEKLAEIK